MRKRDKLKKKQAKTAMCKYAKRCRRLRQRATATKSSQDMWNFFLAQLSLSSIFIKNGCFKTNSKKI